MKKSTRPSWTTKEMRVDDVDVAAAAAVGLAMRFVGFCFCLQ